MESVNQIFHLERLGQPLIARRLKATDAGVGTGRTKNHQGCLLAGPTPASPEILLAVTWVHHIEDDRVTADSQAAVPSGRENASNINADALFFQAALEGFDQRLILANQEDAHESPLAVKPKDCLIKAPAGARAGLALARAPGASADLRRPAKYGP
jgi:hypothetical protein